MDRIEIDKTLGQSIDSAILFANLFKFVGVTPTKVLFDVATGLNPNQAVMEDIVSNLGSTPKTSVLVKYNEICDVITSTDDFKFIVAHDLTKNIFYNNEAEFTANMANNYFAVLDADTDITQDSIDLMKNLLLTKGLVFPE